MDGRVAYTWAPKAPDAFTKTVVEAQKGKGSLQGNEGLSKLLGHHPAATGVVGLDVKRFVEWLRGIPGLGEMLDKELPKEVVLGQDLTDLFLVTETREDGVAALEFVVSSALIDQVVQYLSMPGGGGPGPMPVAPPPAPPE